MDLAGQSHVDRSIDGHNENTNVEAMNALCVIMDELAPRNDLPIAFGLCDGDERMLLREGHSLTRQSRAEGAMSVRSHNEMTPYLTDRPGHDQRYATDASKIQKELGWVAEETFETGLRNTVEWHLKNLDWCQHVQDGGYQRQRLGVAEQRTGVTQ